jgi:hypothetical protein
MSKKSNNAGEINERVRKLEQRLQDIMKLMLDTDINLRNALRDAEKILQGTQKFNKQDLEKHMDSARSGCVGTKNKSHDAWQALHGFKA